MANYAIGQLVVWGEPPIISEIVFAFMRTNGTFYDIEDANENTYTVKEEEIRPYEEGKD